MNLRSHALVASVLLATALQGQGQAEDPHDPVQPTPKQVAACAQVIADLRQFEDLYRDIEVHLDVSYELKRERFDEMSVIDKHISQRGVVQGGRFRIERDTSLRTRSRERTSSRLTVSDGERTRGIYDERVVNNRDEAVEPLDLVKPHMLLLYPYDRDVHLSTYLQGAEAISAANPGDALAEHLEIVSSYHGQVMWRDLPCRRVFLDIKRKESNSVVVRWEFWLAESRNFIPVRMFSYSFKFSAAVPLGEGEITEMVEIKPGLWYPLSAYAICYKGQTLRESGEQVPAWKQSYTVKKVSAAPSYPKDFFALPAIPDGALVYHIDSEGQVIEAYREGDMRPFNDNPQVKSILSHWWLAWINLIAFAVLGAIVAFRKLGRASGDATAHK